MGMESSVGFLRVGEKPASGIEQVQMILKMIGTETPGPGEIVQRDCIQEKKDVREVIEDQILIKKGNDGKKKEIKCE